MQPIYTGYWALDYNNSYSNRLLQFHSIEKATSKFCHSFCLQKSRKVVKTTGRIFAFPVSGNVPETMMKCYMFLCGCQISFLRIGVIPFKFSYAVLLQYKVESPIEFLSCIVYQLSDVSGRFPKISIGGLKWIFALQEISATHFQQIFCTHHVNFSCTISLVQDIPSRPELNHWSRTCH